MATEIPRRTPQPGDSYEKGDQEIAVVSVTRDGLVFFRSRSRYDDMVELDDFHRQITLATWGRA